MIPSFCCNKARRYYLKKKEKNLGPSKTEISVIKRKSKSVLDHEYNRMADKLKAKKNVKFETHEE
jgi:hypothetical protein